MISSEPIEITHWLHRLPFAGAAHVWRIDLDCGTERITALKSVLSPEEQARAACFQSEGDSTRYVTAHGSLRVILGRYLNISPSRLQITCTPEGKPVLDSADGLEFNLSHSGPLALLAVAHGCPIGIDMEQIRTDFPPDALARRFFSPPEAAAVYAAPPAQKHRVFLRYWTGKEAYLKAVGMGLAFPLNQITVSLQDGSLTHAGIFSPFRLWPICMGPEFVAAVALARGAKEMPGS